MSTRSVIQSYMDKMGVSDFMGAFDLFAPHGTYTIIGDTPASKTFVGPYGIKEGLVPLLANGFKKAPVVHCSEIIVEGNRGVALGHGEGPGAFGLYKQKHYAFVFRVEDDRVTELVEFMDPTQLSLNCFGQTLSAPK
jgi:ketosteroid isomerase-like protein